MQTTIYTIIVNAGLVNAGYFPNVNYHTYNQ